jgi:extracellular factor (EF) 3-hydroxypalmitic acid methyl ester biosynthesis protein
MLAQHLAFLERLVQRGGPQDDEHLKMDAWIAGFYDGLHDNEAKEEWLDALREVLRPVLIPGTMHGWAYLKPHGYAGDFEIIDRHYLNYVTADPALAAWDRYWQAGAAAKAVRNRKSYFHQLLEQHAHSAFSKRIAVLNIASGPGRDVYEFLHRGPQNVCFECLDQDSRAVEHASALCREHSQRVSFIEANVLKYHPARCYDVIWSAGLFDYFSDRTFKLLLRRLIPSIAPGGQLVIGNFSENNPNHHWLHFCEWHLHHRSGEQLVRLALEAGALRENVTVGKEPEGVNLFLHINQPAITPSAV